MSVDSNPFRAPVARVHDHIESVMGNFIPEGRRVPTGNGVQWLARGWQIFRSAPGTWVGISIALIVIMMVIGMIPVVNLAVNLLGPVFIGGIIIGCRAIEEGEGLRFAHLFAGFSTRLGGLLLVGLLYLLAVLGAAAIFGIIVAVGAFAGAGASEPTLAVTGPRIPRSFASPEPTSTPAAAAPSSAPSPEPTTSCTGTPSGTVPDRSSHA